MRRGTFLYMPLFFHNFVSIIQKTYNEEAFSTFCCHHRGTMRTRSTAIAKRNTERHHGKNRESGHAEQ